MVLLRRCVSPVRPGGLRVKCEKLQICRIAVRNLGVNDV